MAELQQLSPVTLQEQLYQKIVEMLQNGTYKAGDKLPTELQFCEMYNVSRVTVRKVLGRLVEEQYLTKIRGKGTFVKIPKFVEKAFSGGSFTDTCLRMNAVPSTRIISLETIPRPQELDERIGTSVIHLTRLRLVDNEPCIVEEDYFPQSYQFLLNEPLEQQSILDLICEKTGDFPSYFEDYFQVSHANKSCAALLSCATGHALMKVSQNVFAADDQLIYINEQYIMSERYVYAVRSSV